MERGHEATTSEGQFREGTTPEERGIRNFVARWMEELWQKGNLDAIEELHAPEFRDRSPAGRDPDNAGFRDGLRELYAAFPDFEAVIEDLVVEAASGKVALRWSARGTHRGAFLGWAPTGRTIVFRGIEILRLENGTLIERWGEWDGLDLIEQLGS